MAQEFFVMSINQIYKFRPNTNMSHKKPKDFDSSKFNYSKFRLMKCV